MKRIPLETVEHTVAAIHFSTTAEIGGLLILDHPLDISTLKEAIKGTMAEFPALGCRVRVTWGRSDFEPIAIPDSPLKVIETARIDEARVPESFKDFFRLPIDIRRGPLVKFLLLQSPGKAILGVSVNHTASDARGMRCILHALAERYTAIKEGREAARPTHRADRGMKPIYQGRSFSDWFRTAGFLLRHLVWLFTWKAPSILKEPPGQARLDLTALFFQREETERIRAKAKNFGITINDLLLASLVRSYYRYLGDVRLLRVAVAQDLRPFVPEDQVLFREEGYGWLPVGNIAGLFFVDFNDEDLSQPLNLLKIASGKVQWHKWNQTVLKTNSLFTFMPPIPIPIQRWITSGGGVNTLIPYLKCSTILSNIGTIAPEFLRFGEARPVSFAFILPLVRSAGLVAAASGVGDSICLVLTHPEGYEPAKKIADLMKEEILA